MTGTAHILTGLTVDEYKAIIAVEGMSLTPEAEARLRIYEADLKTGTADRAPPACHQTTPSAL